MNKGFTLIELITVISILGILVVVTTPAYDTVSNNIKTRNFNSKKENIKANVLSFVEKYYKNETHDTLNEKTLCFTTSYLIQNGIISSDSETEEYIENNVTGERYQGNSKGIIKVYYDSNFKLKALFVGENGFDNTCSPMY